MALDPDQLAVKATVARHERGVVRVLAGAGAGKTETAVETLVAESKKRLCTALSFTRKAAEELRDRCARKAGGTLPPTLVIGTAHSLGLRKLRAMDPVRWDLTRCASFDSRAPGVPEEETIWRAVVSYDRDGIPGLGGRKSLNVKLPVGLSHRDYQAAYALLLGRAPSSLDSDEALRFLDRIEREQGLRQLSEACWLVEESLKATGAFTMDQALYEAMLVAQPMGGLVLVDEGQDNNRTQLVLAQKWAGPEGLLVLVGDARQSIYGFRGADPDGFADVEVVEEVCLARNYRSLAGVVEAGNIIADGEPWAKGPPGVATRGEGGLPVRLQAQDVVDEVQALLDEGVAPKDIALLSRTNAEAGLLEAAIRPLGVPVNRLGAPSFLAGKLPQAMISWCILAQEDDLTALESAKNAPITRYLSHRFIPSIKAVEADTLIEAIVKADPQRGPEIARWLTTLRSMPWEAAVAWVAEQFEKVLTEGQDGLRRAVAACRDIALRSGSGKALQHALDNPAKPRTDGLVISTIHRAKGLEWPVVFANLDARYFGDDEAENGRLAYTAVTRARDRLFVVYDNQCVSRALSETLDRRQNQQFGGRAAEKRTPWA